MKRFIKILCSGILVGNMILNSKKFNLNNNSIAKIKNGITFITFRALGNSFKTTDPNVEISWNSQTKTAIMKFEELGEKVTSKNSNNTTTQTTQNAREIEEEVVRLVNYRKRKK